MTPARELELACDLRWRLRKVDPEGAAMASQWRMEALARARQAGVPEREIEGIDERMREREGGR